MQFRIKELCMARGLAVGELAERIDVSKTSTSAIITGRINPKLTTLEKIAEVLGVSIAELFEEPKQRNPVCPHCGKPIVISKADGE